MVPKSRVVNQSNENKKHRRLQPASPTPGTLAEPARAPAALERLQRAPLDASALAPSDVLQLQRTVGNWAVSQITHAAAAPSLIRRLILDTETDFDERPSEPHREKALEKTVFAGQDVPQTRHHIIPWNMLSAFVRTAYDRHHMFAVTDVLTPAVATMMANSPRMKPKTGSGGFETVGPDEEGGTRMQGSSTQETLTAELGKSSVSESIKSKLSTAEKEKVEKNSESLDAITTAYCWMPGNLFLGPLNTLRLDDPDEKFEAGAADQVGSKFDKFQETYNRIAAYVKSPTALKAREIRDFLREVAGQTTPYPFKEECWLRVEDGKQGRYYLKKNADLPTVKAFLTPKVPSEKPKLKGRAPLSPEKLREIEEKKKAAAAKKKQPKPDDDE